MKGKVKHVWDPELMEYVPEVAGRWEVLRGALAKFYHRARSRTLIEYALAIGFLLRLVQMGKGAFWYDEGVSVVFARLPWSRMIQATAGDVHPPLYYVLLWLWGRTGIPLTELTARIPSLVFSTIAVFLTWKIVNHRELQMTTVGKYVVIAWVVISPLQLHYAQETRMYALLQAEVLAGIYFLLNRQKPFLTIVMTLMLYTHNYAVFYVPTFAFVALVVDYAYIFDQKTSIILFVKKWFVYFALPVLLWVPWFVVLLRQMGTVAGGYWIQPVTPPAVLFVMYQMLFAYSMPPTFQGLGILLTCGVLLYTAWRVYRDRPSRWVALVALAFGPLLLAVLLSVVWKPVLLFRGLIGTAVPLSILVVKSIEKIKVSYKRAYAYLVIFATLVAGVIGHYRFNAINKGTTTTWVQGIVAQMRKGDVVVALNDNGVIAMKTYAPETPMYKLAGCGKEPLGSLSPETRSAIGVEEKRMNELIFVKERTVNKYGIAGPPDDLRKYNRVFFISTVAPISPQCEIDQAQTIISDDSVKLVEDLANNEYMQAGVYLVPSKGY